MMYFQLSCKWDRLKLVVLYLKRGLLINSRAPPDVDARIFSALCSTIMGAAEAASGQMNTGSVNEISVRTEKGIIILKPAGDKAIFNALTEPDAQLGLILFEMESRASQVNEILKEM